MVLKNSLMETFIKVSIVTDVFMVKENIFGRIPHAMKVISLMVVDMVQDFGDHQ